MSQTVYIVYTEKLKPVADILKNSIFCNGMIKINDSGIDANSIKRMATLSTTEYFYVVKSTKDIIFDSFDFNIPHGMFDREYVTMWNGDPQVLLFNKFAVLKNPELYTDSVLASGDMRLNLIYDEIFKLPVYDIVFLNYDEENADIAYLKLKERFPRIIKSKKIKGIKEAHKAAANLVKTNMFYVVDADAEIVESFDFSYNPTGYNQNTVHVWKSINPINDLVYGYGGVKLFPTKKVKEYTGTGVDFTTSVGDDFKLMDAVSNVTKFNVNPFATWRSAFRECVKLSSAIMPDDAEIASRLDTWCNVGMDREFGKYAVAGAIDGRKFGELNKNQPENLRLINDYNWLLERFKNLAI